MTQPQYPYFPPPHPTGPVSRAEEPRRRSTIDTIFTLFMSLGFLAAAPLSLFISAFWMMDDECEAQTANQCDPPIGWALLAAWGGVAVAALIVLVGSLVAAKRHSVMWIWPTLGLVLVVVGYSIGYGLLVHWEAHYRLGAN